MLSGMLFKSEANCIRNSDHWGQAWKSSIRFSVGIVDLDAIKQAVS